MSWMKNMWNKMFSEDTETEEKHYVRSEESQHVEPKPQDSKPAPFRFPLISDEEAKGMPVENRKPERREEKPRFDSPLKETEEKAYELDALEPSGKLPKPNAGRNKKKRPHVPKTAEPQGLDLPGNTTRRFQPTRVASPVHGFTDRPAPIDELLEQEAKKRAELERKNDWSQRSLQELYKKSDDQLPQAKKPRSSMETTVYKPVEHQEQAPKAATVSERTHEKAEAEEEQQAEKKPEPQYEWADRSLQDLLPKNQKAAAAPEQVSEQAPEQAEVTVYRTADQEQSSNDVEDAGSAEENEEITQEDTGKGGPPAIAEPSLTESETHTEVGQTAQPESEREEPIHSPEPKPVLPQAKTQDNGKKERTVPFNVLMLKSDKERLPKQQQAPTAEKKRH